MPDQVIKIKRRVGGAAGAPTLIDLGGAAGVGQMGYNDNGDTLDISNGTAVRRLIGANRQVELTGAQTITGDKTIAVDRLFITGAANDGELLTVTDAATGELAWSAAPSQASSVTAPITGNGTTTPLGVTPANQTQVEGLTDNIYPVTALGLSYVLGDMDLDTTATTVTGAVNELLTRIVAMTGAIILIGTYDATPGNIATAVTPGFNSPFGAAAGPLPAAGPTNQGWYVIVSPGGAGGGNSPAGPFATGDWLLSTGAAWLHFEMNLGTITAGNVSITTITGSTSTTVQDALEELFTGDVLEGLVAVETDGTSILGDGTTAGTPPGAGPLYVSVVDGGTF